MAWLQLQADGWLATVQGNTPLLLTFCHAGQRRIDGIEIDDSTTRRQNPGLADCGYNTGRDTRTEVIAEAILAYLDWQGIVPYIIVGQVHRMDMDLNRSWQHNQIGYQNGGVSVADINNAQQIYDAYSNAILAYSADIRARWPAADTDRAFHFDIHGISLAAGVDIELGTLNGNAADTNLVYGSTGVTLSVMAALQNQGFSFAANAATNATLEGCEILSTYGRHRGGLNAVQIELDQAIRGIQSPSLTAPERLAVTRETGRSIGMALEQLILSNGYPVERRQAQTSADDDAYIILSS